MGRWSWDAWPAMPEPIAIGSVETAWGPMQLATTPRGILLIGERDTLPEMGPYALPGNNYHVYDYALFWANVRADAERRLTAFEGRAR